MTTTIADRPGLLEQTPVELDARFQASPAGPIPAGDSRGTIIFLPGTPVARLVDGVLARIAWRGKIFRPETQDLKNKVGPTGIPAVRARVYEAPSWLDDKPCIVLDYSETSKVAGWIRDEIREVEPGVYLGLVWGVGRLFGGRKLVLRFALSFRP